MATETSENLLLQNRSADLRITMVPSQPKKMSHLPKRPPVDLAFSDLNYTVRQGKGEFLLVLSMYLIAYLKFDYSQLYGN